MDLFCPLVASLVEKINFSSKQKFCEFKRICHIYVSNCALCIAKINNIVREEGEEKEIVLEAARQLKKYITFSLPDLYRHL